MGITVLRPGAMSTIQDLGRTGYQHIGVPVSGAMDAFALKVGNLLVGNELGAAGLEMTLIGPVLQVDRAMTICVTGAQMDVSANGMKLPGWAPVAIEAGTTLRFGSAKAGCRAYLAIAGGILSAAVMGSRSTLAKCDIGGRPLAVGDVIACGAKPSAAAECRISPYALESIYGEQALRIIPSRDFASFDADARAALVSNTFTVSGNSDRMGYRIGGHAIAQPAQHARRSEGVAYGTVQVTPDGGMIVLMADRQTTGGYPTLGTIASCDHARLAQMRPGSILQFALCTAPEAAAIKRRQLHFLGNVAAGLKHPITLAIAA